MYGLRVVVMHSMHVMHVNESASARACVSAKCTSVEVWVGSRMLAFGSVCERLTEG